MRRPDFRFQSLARFIVLTCSGCIADKHSCFTYRKREVDEVFCCPAGVGFHCFCVAVMWRGQVVHECGWSTVRSQTQREGSRKFWLLDMGPASGPCLQYQMTLAGPGRGSTGILEKRTVYTQLFYSEIRVLFLSHLKHILASLLTVILGSWVCQV